MRVVRFGLLLESGKGDFSSSRSKTRQIIAEFIMAKPLSRTITITLTDFGLSVLDDVQQQLGCASRSETIEWLALCQKFSAEEARALLANRRQRGERTAVTVLPDDAELPPEG